MVELNLLPDVKLEYLRARRARGLVFALSALVAVAAITLLIVLFSYNLLQKKHLRDLDKDIKAESAKLEQTPQINKILTVQNQLQSLTDLHASKPASSRLLGYLNELTPAKVSISNLNVDFAANTINITGSADALSSVNKYIDTLKFTTFSDDSASGSKAFSNIVLSSYGVTSEEANLANYTIDLSYDPLIFDITQKVKLSVPNLTTTRATIEQPSDLFQAKKGSN